MVLLLLAACLLSQPPAQTASESAAEAAESVEPAESAPAQQNGPAPNLLGKVNTAGGEARRNENVFITALDNNSQRESNTRLGATATLIQDFHAANRYFGAEFGVPPTPPIHLAAQPAGAGLHGRVFWTHGNSAFNARSFFQVGGVQPARDNHYGFQLAAPAWRRARLTLSGSQQHASGFVNGNVLVPRANERTCLSPDPDVCAIINRWFTAWPLEAPNRPDINERALNTNAPQSMRTGEGAATLDQSLTATQRLTARYTFTGQTLDAFQLVAGQNPDTTTRAHDARLTHSWSASARTLLDTTLGFSRATTLLVPEPDAVGPQVQVGTAFEKLGPGPTIPIDRIQNRYRAAARLRRDFAAVSLYLGGNVSRLQFNGREASSNRGNFFFRNDFGLDAITLFRLGIPNRYTTGIGGLDRGFRRWEPQLYAQAQWRATPALTVSTGLRYQPAPGQTEVNGLTPIPFHCDCNNLAPNLGLAWRAPRQCGVLRAAYSVQYGDVYPATLQQLRWNPPLFQKIEIQTPDLLSPLPENAAGPGGRAIVFHVPEDLRTPYSHHYNASWEFTLPRRAGSLQLSYIGTRTWKLLYMQYNNRAVPIDGIPQITATINDRRPDTRYFDFRHISNSSRAYYDALRVNYTLTGARGLTLETSYWWSKAIDAGASYVNIAAGEDATQGQSQAEWDVTADLRGPSTFDHRHASLTRVAWAPRLPAPVLRNWRTSAVVLLKSGLPFTVMAGSDAPGYGNVDGVSSDRPHLMDPSILGRTVGDPDTAQQRLPREAFAFIAPTEQRGNLGVNTFRRGGIANVNLSLDRRWLLSTERSLLFRAESINFLNTPQFAAPVFDLSNPAFGKITNTLNDGRAFRFTLEFAF